MDTPRKWQIASIATAVASMGLGGVLLARPTDQAVASIDLDLITDNHELTIASPDSSAAHAEGTPETPQIVPPETIEPPTSPTAPSVASTDSPDAATSSRSADADTTAGQTGPNQPALSSPHSATSVDSPSSIDS